MKGNSRSRELRIATWIYCAIYLLGLLEPSAGISSQASDTSTTLWYEASTVYLSAVLFLVATILTFFSEKWAGILFMAWHFLIVAFALLLWPEAGMVLLLALPMLYIGAFFYRNWQIKNGEYTTPHKKWKLILQVLLINYVALYTLTIFANVVPGFVGWELNTNVDDLRTWGLTSPLGLLLILAAVVFYLGAWLSRKRELYAGILMVAWYMLIYVLNITFPEFANSGPSKISGLAILAQGVLYIIFYRRFRQIPEEA